MTIDGKDVQKDPEEAKRAIGYLPELPPLYVDMTVREYLDFVAELKKVPKKERKQQIDEVMEMTQITDMQQRLIRNLSKGYRQRVGLAQAILGYPASSGLLQGRENALPPVEQQADLIQFDEKTVVGQKCDTHVNFLLDSQKGGGKPSHLVVRL